MKSYKHPSLHDVIINKIRREVKEARGRVEFINRMLIVDEEVNFLTK